jgi:hypothetical protein
MAGEDGNTEDTGANNNNQNAGAQAAYDKLDQESLARLRKMYKDNGITRVVPEAELRSHMRNNYVIITPEQFAAMAKTETDQYTPEEKAAAAGGGAATGTGYNLERLRSAWLSAAGRYEPNAAGLAKFVADNSGPGGFAEGVTIGGSKKNKLYLGNESGGTFLADVIRGTSGSSPAHDWDASTSSGGSQPAAASTTETPAQRAARLAAFGLGPNGLQNQAPGPAPAQPTLGDMMGPVGPFQNPGMYTPGDAYKAPDYVAPAPFAAPTAADMGQDPGYQFRLSEGQKALERSGAARGVTNTGGNMKGLLDYGQQAASQEYGKVYDRNLNTYNTNAANAFQQYSTNALANNAYNQDTEARKSGAFGTNTNLYQQAQTDAYNRSQQAYNDAVAKYQAGITNQRNYERDRSSDLFRAAGV